MSQAPNLHFARQLLNAVKCDLTELTARSTSFTIAVSSLLDNKFFLCARARITRVLSPKGVVAVFWRCSQRFLSVGVS